MSRSFSLPQLALLFVCLVLTVLTPRAALADALPPDPAACSGAEDGDRCAGGRCEATKCTERNKSYPDASSSPIREFDCLVCVEHDDGGCNASPGRLASNFGPWLFAGSLALLVTRRKRER